MPRIVPAAWMPAAKMERIIAHWTAGTHKATEFDRVHYHILIEADGKLVRGIPSIVGNAAGQTRKRAHHTLNCNTGSIGVSLCCMGGSTESPFNPGKWPMTAAQWDALVLVLADLSERYGITIGPKTVLSHAEVQSNLSIKQRGKWDFTRLAFAPEVKGAKACGDRMRADAKAALRGEAVGFASLAGDDGGEPDDPPVLALEDDDRPPLNVQPSRVMYSIDVETVQRKLDQLGYHEVGGVDGLWGGKTAAAIAAFKNDRGLTGPAVIDAELRQALDSNIASGWTRPIAEARATITAEKIAPTVPAVKQSLRQWVAAKWTALTTLAGALFAGVSEKFDWVSGYVQPVKHLFADVPGWLWLFAIAGIAALVWMNGRWTAEAIVQDKRTGRLN